MSESAVRELHKKITDDVLPWACYEGDCDHDPEKDCPLVTEDFCQCEANLAYECGYESYPAAASWPCATIRALDEPEGTGV